MSNGTKPRPVLIERRSGKLFQASRPVRFKNVLVLIVAALALGALLALGLKRVVVLDSRLHNGEPFVADGCQGVTGTDVVGKGMNA